MTSREIIRELIDDEGGYVDHPDDPGGPTKYGITLKWLRRIRPHWTRADLRRMTLEDAEGIYLEYWFEGPRIAELPSGLRAAVLDFAVHSGRKRAIRYLQRILGVSEDGVIGVLTLAEASRVLSRDPSRKLITRYCLDRLEYLWRVATARPKQRYCMVTKRGRKGHWIRRVEEMMTPDARMTEQEFQARIGEWT